MSKVKAVFKPKNIALQFLPNLHAVPFLDNINSLMRTCAASCKKGYQYYMPEKDFLFLNLRD
jgi:hypothetical protein